MKIHRTFRIFTINLKQIRRRWISIPAVPDGPWPLIHLILANPSLPKERVRNSRRVLNESTFGPARTERAHTYGAFAQDVVLRLATPVILKNPYRIYRRSCDFLENRRVFEYFHSIFRWDSPSIFRKNYRVRLSDDGDSLRQNTWIKSSFGSEVCFCSEHIMLAFGCIQEIPLHSQS